MELSIHHWSCVLRADTIARAFPGLQAFVVRCRRRVPLLFQMRELVDSHEVWISQIWELVNDSHEVRTGFGRFAWILQIRGLVDDSHKVRTDLGGSPTARLARLGGVEMSVHHCSCVFRASWYAAARLARVVVWISPLVRF